MTATTTTMIQNERAGRRFSSGGIWRFFKRSEFMAREKMAGSFGSGKQIPGRRVTQRPGIQSVARQGMPGPADQGRLFRGIAGFPEVVAGRYSEVGLRFVRNDINAAGATGDVGQHCPEPKGQGETG